MKKLVICLLALGIVGCAAQVPDPSSYKPSTQPKMLAAHHWNLLATDIASRLKKGLGKDGRDSVLFVSAAGRGTVFLSSFGELLETQLMQQGFGVTRSPAAADLNVEYVVTNAGRADLFTRGLYTEVQPEDGDILVNVSVLNGDRYVTRITEIFYIDDNNRGEYIAGSLPGPTRLINVVGDE